MNIKQFKSEFRFVCDDVWGASIDAWFECAAWLNYHGCELPKEWNYSPGLGGDGREKECYWHDIFSECTTDELFAIGNLLFRYCSILEKHGLNY